MKSSITLACAFAAAACFGTVDARFGQENAAAAIIRELDGKITVQPEQSGVIATIAGGSITPLLGATNPCDLADLMDDLVEFGNGLSAEDRDKVVEAARRAMHVEKNFSPFEFNAASVCLDPAKPQSEELRGILPLVDPVLPGGEAYNQKSDALLEQILSGEIDGAAQSQGESIAEQMVEDFEFTAIQNLAQGAQGAEGQGAEGQGAEGQGAEGQGAEGQGAEGQGAEGQGAEGKGAQGAEGKGAQGAQGAEGKGAQGAEGKGAQGAEGKGAQGAQGAEGQGAQGAEGQEAANNQDVEARKQELLDSIQADLDELKTLNEADADVEDADVEADVVDAANEANNQAAGNKGAVNNNAGGGAQQGQADNQNAGGGAQQGQGNNENAGGGAQQGQGNNENAGGGAQQGEGNNQNAGGGAEGQDGGAIDLGECQEPPTIEFAAGLDGRAITEFSFRPANENTFPGQATALDPTIIVNFLCDQLGNQCNAKEAEAKCDELLTDFKGRENVKGDGSIADEFNAAFGVPTNFAALNN